MKPWLKTAAFAGVLAAALSGAQAAELHVMTSGGFTAAYYQLGFQQVSEPGVAASGLDPVIAK